MSFFEYPVSNIRVVDGDTFECDIHLGLDITLSRQMIRMLGIDAPEKRGADKVEGEISKEALLSRIEESSDLFIRVGDENRDSFGRCLGTLFDGEESINQWMIDLGFAYLYED